MHLEKGALALVIVLSLSPPRPSPPTRLRGFFILGESKGRSSKLHFFERTGESEEEERATPTMASDTWMREYGEVKASCDEIYEMIRERNAMTSSSSSGGSGAREQDVHKLSAHCRRKLTSLSSKINDLEGTVSGSNVTQREASRRTELVHALRVRKDQLKDLMSRDGQRKSERTKLLGATGESLSFRLFSRSLSPEAHTPAPRTLVSPRRREKGLGSGPAASETVETAGLDSRGILQLQKQALRSQDDEIAELGKAVRNTKHVALAINEEVDLHQHHAAA